MTPWDGAELDLGSTQEIRFARHFFRRAGKLRGWSSVRKNSPHFAVEPSRGCISIHFTIAVYLKHAVSSQGPAACVCFRARQNDSFPCQLWFFNMWVSSSLASFESPSAELWVVQHWGDKDRNMDLFTGIFYYRRTASSLSPSFKEGSG